MVSGPALGWATRTVPKIPKEFFPNRTTKFSQIQKMKLYFVDIKNVLESGLEKKGPGVETTVLRCDTTYARRGAMVSGP